MDADYFQYTGRVKLLCQEGGCADYSIELLDTPSGDVPRDITHKAKALLTSADFGTSLAAALLELFQDGDPDNLGDVPLAPLRITIERL